MEGIVKSDNRGFTLVEIMIALVITLIISMGLMQTTLLGIDSNMVNLLREEAISIAGTDISQANNEAYPPINTPPAPVLRNFRRINGFQYITNRNVTGLPAGGCNSQVDVTVTWTWKGQPYNYTTSSLVRNPAC